jgi:uncharacterized phage protein (TIGR01671 family)
MRQILFRGFNRKNNVWLYGFYLQNRKAHFVAPDEFAYGKTWEDYEIDPETLGQYTGLKDRNGKEIYEGDILTNERGDILHVVAYNGEKASFVGVIPSLKEKNGKPFTTGLNQPWLTNKEKKVIGNIHDNQELLTTTN